MKAFTVHRRLIERKRTNEQNTLGQFRAQTPTAAASDQPQLQQPRCSPTLAAAVAFSKSESSGLPGTQNVAAVRTGKPPMCRVKPPRSARAFGRTVAELFG